MDVSAFFKALGEKCFEGGCEKCGARNFCFTAPHSMTPELIQHAIDWIRFLDSDRHSDKAAPTHSSRCTEV